MKGFKKYPFISDYSKKAYSQATFDDDGIIVVDYKRNKLGVQYNPVTIAQYAMSNYNAYIETHSQQNLDEFSKHCNWLINNFVDKGEWGVWYYNFYHITPGFECLKPWVSSMAQGQGISALIRYHSLSDDQNALEIARKALAAYDIPVSKGGVLRVDEKGLKWYEEYACLRMGTVLNGFIFALIGAKEWHEYTGDYDGHKKFNAGIASLKQSIKNFELRLPLMKWTRYDNKFVVHSGRNYHDLHVRQLKTLYDLTSDQFFYIYYHKWKDWQETYSKSFLFRPYQILCRGYRIVMPKITKRK